MKYLILLFLTSLIIAPAFAESVGVTTSKSTYHFGDYLSITINVSKVSGNTASMHIIDANGVKSSPIPIQITNQTTTITAPNPFDSVIYKEGKYVIEFEYDGIKSVAEFELSDSGKTVIPLGSNIIIPQWIDDTISDYNLLKFLADKNTILFPTLDNDVKIPLWYKNVAMFWSEKKITDHELISGIQYLVNQKIIG
jgi:hypothetical protein